MTSALETDIEAIKERSADTQALYREVCALMFFRYGETPTANKLYQLVRKGSMSAPAKALRDFWAHLREKARVDVGQPDLPIEVSSAAGELAAALWRLAGEHATASLSTLQQEARDEIEAARETVRQSEKDRQAALAAVEHAMETAAAERKRATELETLLVEQQTVSAMLREQLAASRSETNAAQVALNDARRDFAAELEKLRASLSQNEQRLAGAEKRALLDIENARAATARVRADLQASRERMTQMEAANRAERGQLCDELAALRTRLATSEVLRAGLETQLAVKEGALGEQLAATGALRQQLETLSARARAAQQAAPLLHTGRRAPLSEARKDRRNVKFLRQPLRKK